MLAGHASLACRQCGLRSLVLLLGSQQRPRRGCRMCAAQVVPAAHAGSLLLLLVMCSGQRALQRRAGTWQLHVRHVTSRPICEGAAAVAEAAEPATATAATAADSSSLQRG
jgi:hypothetical protein